MPSPPRFSIAGVDISAICLEDAVATIGEWVRERRREYVVLTGAHGVVEMQADPELKAINNNAGLITPDGMPIVWLGRWKGFGDVKKVYAPSLMNALFQVSGYRHFLYGGNEGVAERLKGALESRFPGIAVVGTACPPFRPLTAAEEQKTAEEINSSRADIVWVGLGCPKQERWMARFRPLLNSAALIGVGAGFDFLSGRMPLAPVWVQNSGFEWFFRLASEPRRLWPRYSRVVPKFLYYVAREELSRRFGRARPGV